MSYNAKILLDSVSETGKRITTFEITFPRIVLAEAKTHRVIRGMGGNIEEYYFSGIGLNDDENLSRNSASSRAIPFSKQLDKIKENPFIPEQFPLNCSGMQPQEYIEEYDSRYMMYKEAWLAARDSAVAQASILSGSYKIHKQICNRLLEPFMWHTAIVTATEWDNFFALRTNENAQYEIRRIADMMYDLYHSKHEVQGLKIGEWHLPLIYGEDYEPAIKFVNNITWNNPSKRKENVIDLLKKVSVARCARVSYLTHDGKRDIEKDLELFERLRSSGHWSPFEHVATPYFEDLHSPSGVEYTDLTEGYERDPTFRYIIKRSGNFIGWRQYRKEFQNENITHFRKG